MTGAGISEKKIAQSRRATGDAFVNLVRTRRSSSRRSEILVSTACLDAESALYIAERFKRDHSRFGWIEIATPPTNEPLDRE